MPSEDVDRNNTPVEQGHRRLIYAGDVEAESVFEGSAYRPARSRVQKRRISTFKVILSLFGLASAVVLYIGNIIAVTHLSADINTLEKRYQTVLNTNELLRAELSRKSSLERISKIATEELGLIFPQEQPVWLETDKELLEE